MQPPPLRPRGPEEVRALLGSLPEPAAEDPDPAEEAPPDPAALREAVRVGAVYEQRLRERLESKEAPAPSLWRRNALKLWLSGLLVVVVGAGLLAYRYERAANWEQDLARYLGAARNGLSRDTLVACQASLSALDEVLQRDPTNLEARSLRAQTLATLAVIYGAADRGEAEAALEALGGEGDLDARLTAAWLLAEGDERRQAIEEELLVDPPPEGAGASALSLSGAVLLERGEPSLAIARFNAAILAGPGHVPTLVRVGDYYRARGEHQEAMRYYRLALAVAEDHPGALLGAAESSLVGAGDPGQLAPVLEALGKVRRPEQLPLDQRERASRVIARLLAATGDRGAALEELARQPLPGSPAALAALAETYVQIGAPDEGLRRFDHFDFAASEDPELREAWALMLVAAERFRDAASLRARPEERGLLLQIGIAQYHLGQLARARSSLHATVLRGKLPADAVVYLGLVDLESRRFAAARRNLERLGSGSTARPNGRWAWAEYLRRQGDRAQAERVLREAVEADPRTVESHCALGRLLLEKGELEEAMEHLRVAADLAPLHSEARRALARALEELGDPGGAIGQWEAVLDQHPRDGEALDALVRLLLGQGRADRARDRVQAILRALPDHVPAKRALETIERVLEGELASTPTRSP